MRMLLIKVALFSKPYNTHQHRTVNYITYSVRYLQKYTGTQIPCKHTLSTMSSNINYCIQLVHSPRQNNNYKTLYILLSDTLF